MTDQPKHPSENAADSESSLKDQTAGAADQSSLKSETAAPPLDEAALLRAKKRRTVIIWLRITALLFAGFFLLSQCGMSKARAQNAIMESCIQHVPSHPKWQADLQARSLKDDSGALAQQYCVCMWREPLDKLSSEQIQSFPKLNPQQQLDLLGGEKEWNRRDQQCLDGLRP